MGSTDDKVYLVQDHTDTPDDRYWDGKYWATVYRKAEDARRKADYYWAQNNTGVQPLRWEDNYGVLYAYGSDGQTEALKYKIVPLGVEGDKPSFFAAAFR